MGFTEYNGDRITTNFSDPIEQIRHSFALLGRRAPCGQFEHSMSLRGWHDVDVPQSDVQVLHATCQGSYDASSEPGDGVGSVDAPVEVNASQVLRRHGVQLKFQVSLHIGQVRMEALHRHKD